MNYTIIGGDKKEYGPISADDVRQWISEGRLNTQSLCKSETDTAWRTVGSFPEFASLFSAGTPPPIGALPSSSSAPQFTAAPSMDFVDRDYELDLAGCIGHGWKLVTENMGVLFVGALIYWGIEFAASMLGGIPIFGILVKVANFVISGPLLGGLLYLIIRVNRGEPAQPSDVFLGFSRAFGQLFLNVLVQAIFIGICMSPVIIVLFIKAAPLIAQLPQIQQNIKAGQPPTADQIEMLKNMFFACLPVLAVCMIPVMYLTVSWRFSLALVIDKQMDFWTAMRTSWKMVNKHWFQVFGLCILVGLVNLAGVLVCCIGILFAFPVGLAALMSAYETIFGTRKT